MSCESIFNLQELLTLSAEYADEGLYNDQASVRPSVCHIDRQQQRRPAGLLLSAGVYGKYGSTAAAAGAKQHMRVASC